MTNKDKVVHSLSKILKDLEFLLPILRTKVQQVMALDHPIFKKALNLPELEELKEQFRRVQVAKWQIEFDVNWYSRKEEVPSYYIKQ